MGLVTICFRSHLARAQALSLICSRTLIMITLSIPAVARRYLQLGNMSTPIYIAAQCVFKVKLNKS